MTDGGEESALGVVRALGLSAREVQAFGAVDDALFEGFVAANQLVFGTSKRGDIGERGDEAAARHRIAADFDHSTVGKRTLADVRRARVHMLHALLHFFFDRIGTPAVTQVVADEIRDRNAHAQQLFGITEQLSVTTIPCDQSQFAIDDADALAHILQRRFQ